MNRDPEDIADQADGDLNAAAQAPARPAKPHPWRRRFTFRADWARYRALKREWQGRESGMSFTDAQFVAGIDRRLRAFDGVRRAKR